MPGVSSTQITPEAHESRLFITDQSSKLRFLDTDADIFVLCYIQRRNVIKRNNAKYALCTAKWRSAKNFFS